MSAGMKTYHDDLKDPRWLDLRDRIKSRDGWKCVQCSGGGELHVHHTYYRDGRRAWEYRESDLVTLCAECHKKNHGIKPPDGEAEVLLDTSIFLTKKLLEFVTPLSDDAKATVALLGALLPLKRKGR